MSEWLTYKYYFSVCQHGLLVKEIFTRVRRTYFEIIFTHLSDMLVDERNIYECQMAYDETIFYICQNDLPVKEIFQFLRLAYLHE